MEASQVTLIIAAIGSILAFLGTIANMVNLNFKEARTRRWAEEDARALAKQMAEDKEAVATVARHSFKNTDQAMALRFEEMKQLFEEMQAEAKVWREHTSNALAENTKISQEAFKEANGINEKLLAQGRAPIVDTNVRVINTDPIPVKEAK